MIWRDLGLERVGRARRGGDRRFDLGLFRSTTDWPVSWPGIRKKKIGITHGRKGQRHDRTVRPKSNYTELDGGILEYVRSGCSRDDLKPSTSTVC